MLHILAQRVKSYFYINRIVLICLIIGSFFSVITGLYAYGNLLPWPSANSPEQMHNKYFSFVAEEAQPLSVIETFYEYLQEKTGGIVNFTAHIQVEPEISQEFLFTNGSPLSFVINLGDDLASNLKRDPGQEESDRWIYLPFSTIIANDIAGDSRELSIGDQVHMYGETLQVIGVLGRGDALISLDFVREHQLKINRIDFFTRKLLSDRKIQKILADPGIKTPFKVLSTPLLYREMDRSDIPIRLLVIALLLAISIVSYGFLARYMVGLQQKNNSILFLLGMNITLIRRLQLLELIIFSSVTGCLGTLIYLLIYDFFLKHHMLYKEVVYRFSDYFLANVFYVLICLIVTSPFIFIRMRSINMEQLMKED